MDQRDTGSTCRASGLGQHCTYRLTDGCEGGQTHGCPCEGWQAFSEQGGEKLVGRVTLRPTSSPPGQTKAPELSKLETQEGRQPRGWCRRLPLADVPGPLLLSHSRPAPHRHFSCRTEAPAWGWNPRRKAEIRKLILQPHLCYSWPHPPDPQSPGYFPFPASTLLPP